MAVVTACRYCNTPVCDVTRCQDCTAVLADAQERGETLNPTEIATRAIQRRATRVECQVNANVRMLSALPVPASPVSIKLPTLPQPQLSLGMRPGFLTHGRVRHVTS